MAPLEPSIVARFLVLSSDCLLRRDEACRMCIVTAFRLPLRRQIPSRHLHQESL